MLLSARSPSLLSRSILGARPRDRFDLTPTLVGRLYRLPGFAPQCLDLQVRGGDCWVQFGSSSLALSDFDDTLAAYYPAATAWDTEPIGIPVGATRFIIMPTAGAVQVALRIKPTPPAYGGTRQKATWSATDTTVTLALKASLATLATPIHIIARVLSSANGADRAFASLVEASDADNNPRMCLRVNAGNTWGAHYFNSGATSTGAITMTEDIWATVVATFTLNGANVDPTCWAYDDTTEESEVTAAGAVAFTGTYTRLALGGLVNATGNQALDAGDAFSECMVYVGALTSIQKQQFAEKDCPPWDEIVTRDNIYAWAEVVGGKIINRLNGKTVTDVIGGVANLTFATYDGDTIRRHNRLVTQDANGVKNIAYSNAASGVTALPAMSSHMWRAQAHHALRYDPSDPTAAGYATLAAGVARFYAQGDDIDTNIINDSGAAGDTGSLNLTGFDYEMDLYTPAQSGLAYTVTAGEVNLDGTTASGAGVSTGNTLRNWGMFKPDDPGNWPCVVVAVGAGGQAGGTGAYTEGDADSEYGDLAAYLAARGYCVLIVAFADEGETTPWASFDYPERIAEYRSLIEDDLATVVGYSPTKVILLGHSGGGLTSIASAGLTWTDSGAVEIHNDGVATVAGGGTVVGCIQMSGQGTQTAVKNASIVSTAWNTLGVPTMFMTGTLDSGGVGGGSYTDRVIGYDNSTASVALIKVIGRYWHHLYGGACTTSTSDDKKRAYNQRILAQNIVVAFCDYVSGVGPAAARLRAGWNDAQLLHSTSVYATKNL